MICNPGLNEHNDGWCRNTRNNDGLVPIKNWIPGLEEFIRSMPQAPNPYAPGFFYPCHYHSPDANRYGMIVGIEDTTDRDTCGNGRRVKWMDEVSDFCQIVAGNPNASAYVLRE